MARDKSAMQTSPFCSSLAPFPEKKKPLFDLAIPLTGEEQKKLDAAYGEQMRTEHGEYQRLSVNELRALGKLQSIQMEGRGKSGDW